ncbi:MAG: hypothetical protein AB3K77_02070 [Methanosarcinaceae archaeon]|nr:hypothetical protein [Methanosarcina sp. MTP4]
MWFGKVSSSCVQNNLLDLGPLFWLSGGIFNEFKYYTLTHHNHLSITVFV